MNAQGDVFLLGGPMDCAVVPRDVVTRHSDGEDGRFWLRDLYTLEFYALDGGNLAKHVKTLRLTDGRSDHDYLIDLLLLDVDMDLRAEGRGGIRWNTPGEKGTWWACA